MTTSATRHARTHAARLAILRELHGSGFVAERPDKPQLIVDMHHDGLIDLVDGYLVVTKAGLFDLAEADRCST